MTENPPIEMLIVEDTKADLDLALRALRKSNLAQRVHIARDGAEALEFIFGANGNPPWSPEGPKLILLDLKLPKVDGIEVLRQLKADPRTQTIPVVVLTSSKEQSDVAESYRLGVNSYVVKPVDYESFATAVQQVGHYWMHLNHPPRTRLQA
jgi:CheY-like chemotaxis protein